MVYQPPTFSVIRDDYWTRTTTETTTQSPTIPTTEPDDGIPDDGVWFKLQVMIHWAVWVDPLDYRSLEIDVSQMNYVGLAGHTFSNIESESWWTFDEFIVEDGASVLLSMISLTAVDPFDYVIEDDPIYGDYHPITSGFVMGELSYYDTSAPMPTGPAGWLRYSWVEV